MAGYGAKLAILALFVATSAPAAPAKKAKANPHASLIARARASVSSQLIDPYSVQFREVRVRNSDIGPIVCGDYNARNSFGGYVGFKTFVYGGGGLLDSDDPDYGSIAVNCYR